MKYYTALGFHFFCQEKFLVEAFQGCDAREIENAQQAEPESSHLCDTDTHINVARRPGTELMASFSMWLEPVQVREAVRLKMKPTCYIE